MAYRQGCRYWNNNVLSNLGSIPSVPIVLESLRGLVRLSARISTGTGAYFKLLIFNAC